MPALQGPRGMVKARLPEVQSRLTAKRSATWQPPGSGDRRARLDGSGMALPRTLDNVVALDGSGLDAPSPVVAGANHVARRGRSPRERQPAASWRVGMRGRPNPR